VDNGIPEICIRVQKLSRTRTEVVDIFIDRQQTGKTMDMELEELLFAKKKKSWRSYAWSNPFDRHL
jgi:hypothetical protein